MDIVSIKGITKGVIKAPTRSLIYGPPGCGKSYLIAQIKDALFCDIEGGTNQLNISRVCPKTVDEIFELIKIFPQQKEYSTLVIDSWTQIEKLITARVLERNRWPNLEKPGYGKGFEELRQDLTGFLEKLETLCAHGKNFTIIAHSRVMTFVDPMNESYDRYEPDVQKKFMVQLVAAMDNVFFMKHKTVVIETEKGERSIARGSGDRELYTQEKAGFIAKTRFSDLKPIYLNPKAEELHLHV